MDTKSVSERAVQKPPEKRQKKEKTPFKKFLKNNSNWDTLSASPAASKNLRALHPKTG